MDPKEMSKLLAEQFRQFKKEFLESVTNSFKEVHSEIKELKASYSEEVKALRIEMEIMKRQRNIVIFRLITPSNLPKDDYELVKRFCADSLGLTLSETDIDLVRRLGKTEEGRLPPPLLVKFSTIRKKEEALRAAPKLKGKNISVSEDYPKEVQEKRKALIPKLKEARKNNLRAHIKWDKLIIHNPKPISLPPGRETIEKLPSPRTQGQAPTPQNTPECQDTAFLFRPDSPPTAASPPRTKARAERRKK